MSDRRGFSYVEALIALLIVVSAMSIAMSFFVDFGEAMNTESSTLAMQQSARSVVDELARNVRQAGYGIRRNNNYNPAEWQQAIVHGGSHVLSFNADIDDAIGSIPSSQTLTFPTGPGYRGEGFGDSTTGAETYVYTLDATGDDTIDAADRSQAAVGSYNPAGETANPIDYAVFRRVHGFDGSGYSGAIEPLAAHLFTNATSEATFPDDGTSPEPLFTYWLTEDLNDDGLLSPAECVNDAIDSCPPASDRAPQLYLWGDSDFDGALSESEKTALRGLEVGSPSWSKNPLIDAGDFKRTALAAAVDPNDLSASQLDIVDGTRLTAGFHVQLGTGPNSERLYIEQVHTDSLPHRVYLGAPVTNSHAAGASLSALPSTMLRAVRAVGITYSSISDQRDSAGGAATAGRSGRRGTRGLDYRVTPFHRKIEVINMPTLAAAKPTPLGAEDICPLQIVNACTRTASEVSVRYTDAGEPQYQAFVVTDVLGNVIPGVETMFSNSDASIGAVADTRDSSDLVGLVTVEYLPTGTLGNDTVTASVNCIDGAGTTHTSSATSNISVYQVTAQVTGDCLSTVSPRTLDASTTFDVSVDSVGGPVSDHPLELALELDPAFLPTPPDYAAIGGELLIEGTSVGLTGDGGTLAPVDATTDGAGVLRGSVRMSADTAGEGGRLNLITQLIDPVCDTAIGSIRSKIDFFKLTLDSTVPAPGCSESVPCTIGAASPDPEVEARLSINRTPVADAPLDFTTTDINPPSDITGTAASVLRPASGVRTDVLGSGTVTVTNNGSPLITPLTPLRTRVDVTSSGNPGTCSGSAITSSSPIVQFDFEAPADACLLELQPAWVARGGLAAICLSLLNNNNEEDGCPIVVRGITVRIYLPDGATLDPLVEVKRIDGGGVATAASCSRTGAVRLFDPTCRFPGNNLANGESWMFTSAGGCSTPALEVSAQSFFTIPWLELALPVTSGRPMDVTVHYECAGSCEAELLSATYRVNTP